MRSIQILPKDQVLLVKSIAAGGGSSASANSTGVIGPAPASSSAVPSQPQSGDHPTFPHYQSGHVSHGDRDFDQRRPWMPKMDFPVFDGSDVRVWLDKCASYFHLYAYHLIFVSKLLLCT
jgi:hypothetical protein